MTKTSVPPPRDSLAFKIEIMGFGGSGFIVPSILIIVASLSLYVRPISYLFHPSRPFFLPSIVGARVLAAWICMNCLARGQDESQSRNPADRFHSSARPNEFTLRGAVYSQREGNSRMPSQISRLDSFTVSQSGDLKYQPRTAARDFLQIARYTIHVIMCTR